MAEPLLWWCKTDRGELVEHEATPYEGHHGHVRCVPIDDVVRAGTASEDDEPLRDVRSELYAITGRLIRFEWLATDIDLDDRTHGNVIRLGQRLRAVVDSLRPTMVRRPTTTPDNEQVAALLARADEWAATIHPELPAPRSLVSDLADALRAAAPASEDDEPATGSFVPVLPGYYEEVARRLAAAGSPPPTPAPSVTEAALAVAGYRTAEPAPVATGTVYDAVHERNNGEDYVLLVIQVPEAEYADYLGTAVVVREKRP
jgi:hypothetical protein